MNHKPSRTILFLAPLLVLMYLTPKVEENFKSEDEVVKEEIPSWSELLEEEEDSVGVVEPLPIDTIIDSIDTLIIDVNRFSPSYATHAVQAWTLGCGGWARCAGSRHCACAQGIASRSPTCVRSARKHRD